MNAKYRPANAGAPHWKLLLLASALFWQGAASATDPVHVNVTLEGCRNNGTITLPNGSGDFICPNAAYTTGNLGKGWNELDLVPYRVTLDAGNSAPASQTYSVIVEGDNCKTYEPGVGFLCADGQDGHPGYDDLSVPVLNTTLSSSGGSGCTAFSASDLGVDTSGANGVVTTIYRSLTLTQAKNTTCVYDYYQRLALGARLFGGSELHSNVDYGGGQKEVSLPVNQIAEQSLSKDMSAKVDSTVSWNLTKSGDPVNVSFGDVCAADFPADKPVAITITWTKSAAVLGKVNITTNVYATNPAGRTITTCVTDVIYKGTDQSLPPLDTSSNVCVDVGANSTAKVMTHEVALDGAGNIGDWLNDIATATYTDEVTGLPIPGVKTKGASTQIIAGTASDDTADLDDSESITGTGLSFSVAAPSVGSFSGYTAGDETIGPVDWSALAQSASGTVTFNKTVYLDSPLVGDLGTLSDTAHLYTPNMDTPDQTLTKSVDIGISSSATVTLTVSKTIPTDYLANFLNQAGDTLTVDFHIAGALGYTNDISFTFCSALTDTTTCPQAGLNKLSLDIASLSPDTYTVSETSAQFCDASLNCTTNTLLTPTANPLVVDLIPQDGSMSGRCSGTAAFINIPVDEGVRVQVQKLTDPDLASNDSDYMWDFALSGPTACASASAGAGAGFVLFQKSGGGDCLLSDGDYTMTETLKTGWQEDSAVPNNGLDTLTCAFSVNAILDDGKTYSCTFHNTKLGHANVIKTVSGAPPSGTDSFQFQLREGASTTSLGTLDETLYANAGNGGLLAFVTDLVPGNHYQLCEIVLPGWLTTLSPTFVPNSAVDPGADNSVQCVDFTVNAGETKPFTVDNTPPPGGNARTIGFWRNWSACHRSRGHQEDVLGETLTLADPTGIEVGSFYLHSGDGCHAVNLLSKSQMTTGAKMPGDPLFNMTAQLVAAELNITAGAAHCSKVDAAIASANLLLSTYHFDGNTYHPTLTKADKVLANSLATELDSYNNNLPSACL